MLQKNTTFPVVGLLLVILGASLGGCVSAPTVDRDLVRCSALLTSPPTAMTVRFANSSTELRSIYWVHAQNATLVHYQNLQPGESYEQPTYEGHLWVAMRKDGRIASTFCGQRDSTEQDFGR
jgi:hypothetical protein